MRFDEKAAQLLAEAEGRGKKLKSFSASVWTKDREGITITVLHLQKPGYARLEMTQGKDKSLIIADGKRVCLFPNASAKQYIKQDVPASVFEEFLPKWSFTDEDREMLKLTGTELFDGVKCDVLTAGSLKILIDPARIVRYARSKSEDGSGMVEAKITKVVIDKPIPASLFVLPAGAKEMPADI